MKQETKIGLIMFLIAFVLFIVVTFILVGVGSPSEDGNFVLTFFIIFFVTGALASALICVGMGLHIFLLTSKSKPT